MVRLDPVRVEQNVPYDQIVKGIMLGTSRRPGEDYASYQTRMASYNKKEEPADYSGEPTCRNTGSARTCETR